MYQHKVDTATEAAMANLMEAMEAAEAATVTKVATVTKAATDLIATNKIEINHKVVNKEVAIMMKELYL